MVSALGGPYEERAMMKLRQVIFGFAAVSAMALLPMAPAMAGGHGFRPLHPFGLGRGVVGAAVALRNPRTLAIASAVVSRRAVGRTVSGVRRRCKRLRPPGLCASSFVRGSAALLRSVSRVLRRAARQLRTASLLRCSPGLLRPRVLSRRWQLVPASVERIQSGVLSRSEKAAARGARMPCCCGSESSKSPRISF